MTVGPRGQGLKRQLMMVFVTLVAVTVSLTTTGTAAFAKKPVVQPNFTCPSPGVCIFHGDNWDLYHYTWIPADSGGHWIDITAAPSSFNLPWGSINNNSNSDVWFENYTGSGWGCVYANVRTNGAAVDGLNDYRYMWIQYGIDGCSQRPPHAPSG